MDPHDFTDHRFFVNPETGEKHAWIITDPAQVKHMKETAIAGKWEEITQAERALQTDMHAQRIAFAESHRAQPAEAANPTTQE